MNEGTPTDGSFADSVDEEDDNFEFWDKAVPDLGTTRIIQMPKLYTERQMIDRILESDNLHIVVLSRNDEAWAETTDEVMELLAKGEDR